MKIMKQLPPISRSIFLKIKQHKKPGFIELLLPLALTLALSPFFLIPAGITGLLSGSYGIYKSFSNPLNELNDRELIYAATATSEHINKQYKTAVEILEEKTDNADFTEPLLEQLAQVLFLNEDMQKQKDALKQAIEALQQYTYCLEKRLSKKSTKRSRNNDEYQKLRSQMNTMRQIIDIQISSLEKLNQIIIKNALYFDAYELEHALSTYYDNKLAHSKQKEHLVRLKKRLRQDSKNLSKTKKKIMAYPALQTRLTLLDQHLGKIQENITTYIT